MYTLVPACDLSICPPRTGDLFDAASLARENGVLVMVFDPTGALVCEIRPDGTQRRATKPGRPPVAGVPRSEKIQIGFTPAERETYSKAASDAGYSLSEWVRRACARAMV